MLLAHDLGGADRVKQMLENKVRADAEELNLTFTPVSSANHVPKPGNWIVALAYSTANFDYHWWRRDEDGTWSHKPGTDPIMYCDFSDATITDPQTSDRAHYNVFLGYYEVGPNNGG